MIITLAFEAEDLAACAFHGFKLLCIDLNAVSTINTRAELIVSIGCNEEFTYSLLEFIEP
jgi:hypothetical protein